MKMQFLQMEKGCKAGSLAMTLLSRRRVPPFWRTPRATLGHSSRSSTDRRMDRAGGIARRRRDWLTPMQRRQ
jgi:hypothetical protein